MTYPGATTYPGASTYPSDGVTTGPTFTATPQATNLPPRVLLEAADISGTAVTISRYAGDGSVTVVRQGDAVELVGGAVAGFYDYEAPYNQTLYYSLVPADGSATIYSTSSPDMYSDIYEDSFNATTFMLEVPGAWLINPVYPALSYPINMLRTEVVETTDPGVVLHVVPGRADPIPIGDGQRKTPAGTLGMYTLSFTDEAALDALFQGTVALLAQLGVPSSTRRVYEWWSVGTISKSNASGVWADPYREWTIPYTVVARPAGTVQAQWTWTDVEATYPTWQDVFDAFLTNQGLLTDAVGG